MRHSYEQYVGKKINSWTILELQHVKHRTMALVRCSCGSILLRSIDNILRNKSKWCVDCYKKYGLGKYIREIHKILGINNPNWQGTANIPYSYYSQCKATAKRRNIIFNISIDDMQLQWDNQSGKCAYTNRPLFFKTGRERKTVYGGIRCGKSVLASLDRINNDKPYEIGNIQFVTAPVNLMKNTYSHKDFMELVKEIYEIHVSGK